MKYFLKLQMRLKISFFINPDFCLQLSYLLILQDLHYFSDSEHQTGGAGGLVPRQELRRLRNRTLSGLDSLRLGEQARERSHSLTIGGLPQGPRTPCTPTFATEKDAITNFVDFNPAGMKITFKYGQRIANSFLVFLHNH